MSQPPGTRRPWYKVLGPGLVTGAADDDPSGVGTYSQVGAQFGYGMAWTLFFGFPLLASIQAVCAQIGAVTGKGIAQNLRQHYPAALLRGVVALLLIANVINIGADLGAMAESLALLLPGPALAYVAAFGVLSVGLEVWLSYDRYAGILKWSTLSLFAYVAVVFVVRVPVGEALSGTLVPSFRFGRDEAMALVAIFGTTISPYLFFWQAGQEVEEQHRRHVKPLMVSPRKVAGPELARIRADTLIGMGFSHIVALFIVVATAATLHAHGVTRIDSAAQAAGALRPIAGRFADIAQYGAQRRDWLALYTGVFARMSQPMGDLAGKSRPADATPPALVSDVTPPPPAAEDDPFQLGLTLYSASAEFRAGYFDFDGLLAQLVAIAMECRRQNTIVDEIDRLVITEVPLGVTTVEVVDAVAATIETANRRARYVDWESDNFHGETNRIKTALMSKR